MKPNNYYYKRIAKKVDNTIDCDKFKSNVYYMRRIAIKHGGSYTNHRSSNKYLHDWAVALGYTYTDHEYNIKYLYDIAKYYDASTQANQTENHYLIIIHDNIVPPTPSQKLHEIDVELTDGKNTLSYADRTTGNEYATLTFTAKDEENAPIPNLELSLDVTGEQTSTITTDSNGQYEITYNTQGIGDVEIGLSKEVEGSLLIQTYEVHDCMLSDTMTSASDKWIFDSDLNPVYNSNGINISDLSNFKTFKLKDTYSDPVIFEFDLTGSTSSTTGLSSPLVEFDNAHNDKNFLSILGSNSTQVTLRGNSGSAQPYTIANKIGHYKILCESDTKFTVYIDNVLVGTVTNANIPNKGLMFGTGGARTMSLKNVMVKPL